VSSPDSDVVLVEPFPRRVRAATGDVTLVDSSSVMLVHRRDRPPTYAFPRDDVGEAPFEDEPAIPGYVRVQASAVEAWWEESERVTGHPRNPYHRIDCVRSDRRLRVEFGGELLLDTHNTIALFETGHAPKLYVRPDLFAPGVLTPSDTKSYCGYKGTASYWNATVNGTLVPDAAWSYEDPFPESEPIRGLLAFYTDRLEVIEDVIDPASINPAPPVPDETSADNPSKESQ
jgi:uncharacterized protein (DUF427 family)